jgi:predicted CoA-binding protein
MDADIGSEFESRELEGRQMANSKEEFLAQKRIAVVGVSRTKGFGNYAVKELKSKGYQVIPVGRNATEVDGEKCYHFLSEMPEPVGGVLISTPPAETEKVVVDCVKLGIKRVWMQQGSESPAAIEMCQKSDISLTKRACILMYADPKGFHKLHRVVWRLLGKL